MAVMAYYAYKEPAISATWSKFGWLTALAIILWPITFVSAFAWRITKPQEKE